MSGLIAYFFDIKWSFIIALFLIVFAAYVLLFGKEPVTVRQKLHIRSFPVSKVFPDFYGYIGMSLDYIVGSVIWPLYIGVFLLSQNSVYAELGLIVTASMGISIIAIIIEGKVSDKFGGKLLLRIGFVVAGINHLFKFFAKSILSIFLINTSAELANGANRVPLNKGYYYSVNKLEGYRITYWTVLSLIIDFCRAAFFIIIYIALFYKDSESVLKATFVAAALVTMIGLLSASMKGLRTLK